MFLDILLALAAFFIGGPLIIVALLFAGLLLILAPLCLLAMLAGPKD